MSLEEFGCPFGCDNGVSKNSHRQRLRHMLNLTTPFVFQNAGTHVCFFNRIRRITFKGRQHSAFFL